MSIPDLASRFRLTATPGEDPRVPTGKLTLNVNKTLVLSDATKRAIFRADLIAHGLGTFLRFAEEHGRFTSQLTDERLREVCQLADVADGTIVVVMEVAPMKAETAAKSQSFKAIRSLLQAEAGELHRRKFWLVYRNDGGRPYNPGAGSDQGPTAHFSFVITNEPQSGVGVTRLGLTVIDMYTPRPRLPEGAAENNTSTYNAAGQYSGITAFDVAVTVSKNDDRRIEIFGAVGIDSASWGKEVQDFIHNHISNSPHFPWPKRGAKLLAQVGTAIHVTPNFLKMQGEVLGWGYRGHVEFDGKFEIGTHRTEVTVGASYTITATFVDVDLGRIQITSQTGGYAKAFIRYNDGREESFAGFEDSINSSLTIQVGRVSLRLRGELTDSTDVNLQTNNPAGSRPLYGPVGEIARGMGVMDMSKVGGWKGHHGLGEVALGWSFDSFPWEGKKRKLLK